MNVSSVTSNAATASAAATTTSPSSTSSSSSSASASNTLNQQDFLKLLVAQIQYQDPMNPQSNTDMAAQLAQFTSLQQATESSSSLAMMQANGLVGGTVTVQVDANTSASGVVTGVVMSNGSPEITINGKNYALSQVTSVTPATSNSSSGATSSGSTTAAAAPTQATQ
jgi:flagellar basal-body rod modification protein FlgD